METDKIKPEAAAERFIKANPELVYLWIGDLTDGVEKPASLK